MKKLSECNNSKPITAIGKLFQFAAASFVLGRPTKIKIRGSMHETEVAKKALLAAKKFHDTLQEPNSTAEQITQLLSAKRLASDEFLAVFGISFPL